jgi:hypothetical protein
MVVDVNILVNINKLNQIFKKNCLTLSGFIKFTDLFNQLRLVD